MNRRIEDEQVAKFFSDYKNYINESKGDIY